jgi:aerobic-type carbon monoxide dehydrogenase small subunit (CoxS/CutS family)
MSSVTLKINGESHSLDNIPSDMPLLWAIRDLVGLTGTKFGCGIAQCGACTIHLDGVAVRSCSTPVTAADGKEITTIEGLSENGNHPVQQAWMEKDVPQCGYCQAGQIMNAAAFLAQNPNPSIEDINVAMAGNICRCGTYNRIRDAILLAAEKGGAV